MEDSAYESIYTGVYVFVFIIAVTITIFLFKSISDLSEKSYEYGKIKTDLTISEDVPSESIIILSGSEVISYYFNHIRKDLYNPLSMPTNKYYNVTINGVNLLESDSYEVVKNKVGLNNKYKLEYTSRTGSTGIAEISITKI